MAYYKKIAEACNTILAQSNYLGKQVILRGNDHSLPDAIFQLKSTTIRVYDNFKIGDNYLNGVTIVYGGARPKLVIAWQQNDYGNGNKPWELTAVVEGHNNILYSRMTNNVVSP